MKYKVILSILALLLITGTHHLPQARPTPVTSPVSQVTGTLRFHQLVSKIFGNTRTIRVLLPAGYDEPQNKGQRYPVLYLNDGQNVFDASTSIFNPMEWRADETVDDLTRRGIIEPVIVVGIDCAGRRMRFNEYFSYPDEFLSPPMPSPQGKKYPDFLTEEVLPLINRLYRTKTGAATTGIGGSSAGAVAALQAVISKPNLFGLLLMESPSLYIANGQLIRDSKGIRPVRAFLGVGTNESGRPNCKPGDHEKEAVQDVLKLKEEFIRSGVNDTSLRVMIEDCTVHNEEAWAKRFPAALEFLLGTAKSSRNANNMFPQWTHDGKRIAFTSDRDGDLEVYVMNADGSNQVRLTTSKGRDAHPYFSRDGKRILFQSPRANGTDTNIFVMNEDGSDQRQLTSLNGFAGVPVYSPDERAIALMWRKSNDFRDGSKWLIAVMEADGSNLRVITDGSANDQVPNWTRDGNRLLFYSDRTGKNQLYTMRPDGTDVLRLHSSDANDNAAFWSADNKRISFISDRDGTPDLYVMDPNGKNLRRLTSSKATERGGVWSPNGKQIAFAADGDGSSAVFIIDADGKNLRRLTP